MTEEEQGNMVTLCIVVRVDQNAILRRMAGEDGERSLSSLARTLLDEAIDARIQRALDKGAQA